MIFDTISHLPQYIPSDVWKMLESFIVQLSSHTPDGKFWIKEPDIFAQISSYQTKPHHEGRLEAHKKYVDLQILLSGSEIIDVTPLAELIPETDYDKENDIRFYKVSGVPVARLSMEPGGFALFFPQDAHCPQLTPHTGVSSVKKVVIKVDSRHICGN